MIRNAAPSVWHGVATAGNIACPLHEPLENAVYALRTCARVAVQVLSVGVGAEDEGLGHKHALALGGVQQHLWGGWVGCGL